MRKHFECIPCITTKTRRSAIPDSTRRTARPLEIVHLDISRKVEVSLHGYRYTVAFLDDFTAKSDVLFAKNRSELFDCLKIYKSRSEKLTSTSKFQDDEHSSRSRRRKLVRYGCSILQRKWD